MIGVRASSKFVTTRLPGVACDRRKVHAMQDLVKVVTRAKNAV